MSTTTLFSHPFFREDAPRLETGAQIATRDASNEVVLYGRITDKAGRPIGVFRETAAGLIDQAVADWQAANTPEQRAADAKRTMDLFCSDVKPDLEKIAA
mgnify:CR=1 FL=1